MMSGISHDNSGSISAMIQRFRMAEPSSREERQRDRQQGKLREMWWISGDQVEQPRTHAPAPTDPPPRAVCNRASVDEQATSFAPKYDFEMSRLDSHFAMPSFQRDALNIPMAPAVPNLDDLMSREIQAAEDRLRRQFNVPREPTIISGYPAARR